MAVAVAPNPAIASIPDGKEGDAVRLQVNLDESGARYDTLAYAWTRDGGNADEFDDATAAAPTWTRPDVGADSSVSIRCDVTAAGTGGNADRGTTATRADTEPATVEHVPDAVAPTGDVRRISVGVVTDVVNALERSMIDLRAHISGGTYDRLEFAWTLVDFRQGHRGTLFPGVFDSAARSEPTATLPSVDGNTSAYFRCVVTAYGDNGRARRGTTHVRTLQDAHFTILDYPDASVPNVAFDGLQNGHSNQVEQVAAVPSGGQYDEIDWEWFLYPAGADQTAENDLSATRIDDRRARQIRLTLPVVQASTVHDLRCLVSVEGHDGTTERGTLDDRTFNQRFTATPLPEIAFTGGEVPDVAGPMRSRVRLRVSQHRDNFFDEAEYAWSCSRTLNGVTRQHNDAFDDRSAAEPTFTFPDVDEDDESLPFDLSCRVTLRGTDTRYRSSSHGSFTAPGQATSSYVDRAAQAGFGVYVTDEHGNEMAVDAMFPSAQPGS